MMTLAQLAKLAGKLQSGVAQLQAGIAQLMEAGEQAPPDPPQPKRKRWAGPVPEPVRRARQEKNRWRWRLAVELGRDASLRCFADQNCLCATECSRYLTGQRRSIAPGSTQDTNIGAAFDRTIAKMESDLAKRHGTTEIIAKLKRMMFEDNQSHDRERERIARPRTAMFDEVSGKSRRVASL
jgi:X-X-X-Leu-X-X-Gly heptad repeat protein